MRDVDRIKKINCDLADFYKRNASSLVIKIPPVEFLDYLYSYEEKKYPAQSAAECHYMAHVCPFFYKENILKEYKNKVICYITPSEFTGAHFLRVYLQLDSTKDVHGMFDFSLRQRNAYDPCDETNDFLVKAQIYCKSIGPYIDFLSRHEDLQADILAEKTTTGFNPLGN